MLHRLAPLQLAAHSVADEFNDMLIVLQRKLLVLASEQQQGAYPLSPGRAALPIAPTSPITPARAAQPLQAVADADASTTSTDALRAMLRLALVRGDLADHLLGLQALMAAAGWAGTSTQPHETAKSSPHAAGVTARSCCDGMHRL